MRHLKPKNFIHLFIIALLALGTVAAQAEATHGVLRVVKGDIRIIQGIDGKEVKAKLGQKVMPKDTIVAGKDSRAKIVMVDNNEINVSPDSKVQIQNYEYKPQEEKKNVLINVLYGKVRAKVNQKYDGDNTFQVKTPSAVAGVRGTDFMTGYNAGTKATQIVTFSGKVAVGAPGIGGAIQNPVMVSAGQMTSAVLGSAPSAPVNVPKAELASIEVQTDAAKAPDTSLGGRGAASDGGDGSSGGGTQNSDEKGANSEDKSANSEQGGKGKSEGGGKREPSSETAKTDSGGNPPPPPPPPPPTTQLNNDTVKGIISDGTKAKIRITIGN